MESRGSLAAVVVLAAIAVVWSSPAEAVDGCRAKVRRRDGTILVSARNVNGPLQWCTAPGQNCQSFFNDPPCVSGGQATRCVLGAEGTVARITAPAGCRIYLQDNSGAGTGTCAAVAGGAYIRGCTPSGDSPPPGADVSVRVFSTSANSVPSGNDVQLAFNSVRYDSSGFFSLGNPTLLTIPISGKYLVFGHVSWELNTAGSRRVQIRHNGSAIIASAWQSPISDNITNQSIATHYSFSAGDTVELEVSQTSGITLNVDATANYSPEFGMVKLP